MALVALFLRVWHPARVWTSAGAAWGLTPVRRACAGLPDRDRTGVDVWRAWTPWIILSVVVFTWGLPSREGVA